MTDSTSIHRHHDTIRILTAVLAALTVALPPAPALASEEDPAPAAVPSAAQEVAQTPAATPEPASADAPTVQQAPPPAPGNLPASPTAVAAPAGKPVEPAQAADDGYRTSGLIPGVLIGPKATATLLFPPAVMVGAELRVIGYIGASFEYGVFPRNLTVQGYTGQSTTWSAGLRAYPFKGAFFVGVVFGRYDVTLSQAVASYPVPQTATLNVASTYLGPQIGWKWTWDFGLFLGLNLGYGFSLDYQSSLTPTGIQGTNLTSVKENADKYLKTGIPILTLLEIGFLI